MHISKFLAVAASLFVVSGSMAAPFPGVNRAPSARVAAGSGVVPYQEFSNKIKCVLANECEVIFPAIADSGVFIQRVSCIYGIKTGGVPTITFVGIDQQSPFNTLTTNKISTTTDDTLFDANGQTNLFVDVGQKPLILLTSSQKKITGVECTISGFHL